MSDRMSRFLGSSGSVGSGHTANTSGLSGSPGTRYFAVTDPALQQAQQEIAHWKRMAEAAQYEARSLRQEQGGGFVVVNGVAFYPSTVEQLQLDLLAAQQKAAELQSEMARRDALAAQQAKPASIAPAQSDSIDDLLQDPVTRETFAWVVERIQEQIHRLEEGDDALQARLMLLEHLVDLMKKNRPGSD